jgi:hypothetical protein
MIAQIRSVSAPRPLKALAALVVGFGLVAFASPSAQAALVYTVQETLADGVTPTGPIVNTFAGVLTDYTFLIGATTTAGELDLTISASKRTNSTNKLLITVSDTGFTGGPGLLTSVFAPQATIATSAATQTFSSTANGSTTTPTGSYLIPAGNTPPPFLPLGVVTTLYSGPSPHSLSNTVLLSLSNTGDFLLANTRTFITPEPGTLAMAGMGGIGLVGLGLRRRKAAKV